MPITRSRLREVRVIDAEGNNLGVLPTLQAVRLAEEASLDLVEVAPNAEPPVTRIMDFGKFIYAQAKKEREARKTQKQIEIKEIRLRPKTNDHHAGFKVKNARVGWKKAIRSRFAYDSGGGDHLPRGCHGATAGDR